MQEKFTSVVKRKRVRPDAVMIMTSGKLGECGELQAYFDKMGVPFTFSGVEETRTAFNKHETVDLLREEGLPVVKSVLVGKIYHTVNRLPSFQSSCHLVIRSPNHSVTLSLGHLII